jgi:hypothetical protein
LNGKNGPLLPTSELRFSMFIQIDEQVNALTSLEQKLKEARVANLQYSDKVKRIDATFPSGSSISMLMVVIFIYFVYF